MPRIAGRRSRHARPSAAQNARIRSCTTGGGASAASWKRNGNTARERRAESARTSDRSARTSSKNRAMPSFTLFDSGSVKSCSTLRISRPRALITTRTRADRR